MTLTKEREILAVVAGIKTAGLENTEFAERLANRYDGFYKDFQEGRRFGLQLGQYDTVELHVTDENAIPVTKSLEATVALDGAKGFVAMLMGRRRTARKILRAIELDPTILAHENPVSPVRN